MDTAAILRELDESDAIVAKATKGPWEHGKWDDTFCRGTIGIKQAGADDDSLWIAVTNGNDTAINVNMNCDNDGDFIAHARDALPARNAQLRGAIAEIERLRGLLTIVCEDLDAMTTAFRLLARGVDDERW